MNNPDVTEKSESVNASTPASGSVAWRDARNDLPPRGIFILIADDLGRVHETIFTRSFWQTIRGDKFNILWWAHTPDHPGMPLNTDYATGGSPIAKNE